ncbi:hypothetical protein HMPREF0239_04465 [Clostridium sp. ATCC BAA-442]|nr:hypothetical protein HMPREF0239_04465 [Clostridium sp. ATCC BAA-442]
MYQLLRRPIWAIRVGSNHVLYLFEGTKSSAACRNDFSTG